MSTPKVPATINNTDIDSYQGALYASYESGPWFLDGVATYAYNDYDGARHINVGTVNRVAKADYDADQVAIKAKLGHEYNVYANSYLTPYVGLHYIYLDVDDYTETGAGTANLTVQDESYSSLQSTIGVSVHKEIETVNNLKVVPEVHVAWSLEHLDEEQVNTSTFTGGGTSFTTRGFEPANASLNLGTSLAIYSANNIDVRAAYDYEVKNDYDGHAGFLVLRYNF
jgi:outer membrane autotransporter protein